MMTVYSYLIEFFIRSCSALASDPCSPGTRGGRGIPGSTREGRVTPGSWCSPGSKGGRVTPGSRGGRVTPGSGSWCSASRSGSSSIVVRSERVEEQRQTTRVGESRSEGVPPPWQQPSGPHHVSHNSSPEHRDTGAAVCHTRSWERLHATDKP